MKVSVIMCSYNVAAYIDEAIRSILQQTYTNWELIISDDKSTDNTVTLIQKYLTDPRIRLIEHDNNVGYVANKNRAFSYATGDLLTQLDSDDTSTPERLQKQVDVFIKNLEIKICGSNYSIINNEGDITHTEKHEKDFLITDLMLNYPFWFPGLMFRKELIDEFGLFSEYFNGIYGDDHYWAMKVNTKYPIYFIKDALYGYRINPGSITNVFDKPRKLIAQDIIAELYRQLVATGTDWLQTKEEGKLRDYESSLFKNKPLMAERYRMWAAKAIDKRNWKQAKSLLKNSLTTGKAGLTELRTVLYYLRKRYLGAN